MNYIIKHAENNTDLYSILNFAEYIFGRSEQFDRTIWEVRFKSHPELLIYAEVDGQVIGVALSFVEDNGNITVGIVAVDEKYRKHGIVKALMTEVEKSISFAFVLIRPTVRCKNCMRPRLTGVIRRQCFGKRYRQIDHIEGGNENE